MSDSYQERKNSALPAIATNNSETSSIDLNKTYSRKAKVASGISKKENILNKSNNTNSDYDDV